MTNGEICTAALRYAGYGWNIFPCHQKRPLTGHGLLDATTDPEVIRQWWAKWPDANVAVALADLVVLDIDGPEGEESLASLIVKYGPLPQTLESKTGRGRQLFFAAGGATIRNSAGKLGPGLDIRGAGGYVILPPSIHPNGATYVWIHKLKPALLPEWLRALLVQPPSSTCATNEECDPIPEGQRNSTLTSMAGSMRRQGFSVAAILAALLEVNRKRCRPLLPEAEVRRIANSVGRYTPADPAAAQPEEPETSPAAAQPMWQEPMADDAYHGLAGDFVRIVLPHSEADPVALLIQFLVMFGSVIGRRVHFYAEADRHYTNLFGCFVGTTAKARKGTSYGRVHDTFAQVDADWAQVRVNSGLSSGEGLVYQVRDPANKDDGIHDKRLLIFEPEFALVLKVIERDTNTLPAIIRKAWDSGNLRTLTKNSPLTATDAHIAIIGHITAEELRRYITETELASGFANRFLWLCVKRSKCLPDDEDRRVDPQSLWPIRDGLAKAVTF